MLGQWMGLSVGRGECADQSSCQQAVDVVRVEAIARRARQDRRVEVTGQDDWAAYAGKALRDDARSLGRGGEP